MEYREQKHESTIEAAALNPPLFFFEAAASLRQYQSTLLLGELANFLAQYHPLEPC